MEPLPVLYFASCSLNGARADGVGMKLRWDLNAAKANRILFSSNTGDPHFMLSVASGATSRRMARISFNFSLASGGAALMYSVIVADLVFCMLLLN